MVRWNEIKYTLVFNILFPRFFLFILIPCGLLFAASSPPSFPLLVAVLYPTYAKIVLAASLLLFGLSIAANLSISRYLRRHHTQDSPYDYQANWESGSRSSYFRIQIKDKKAFNRMLDEISRNHPKEAIRFWLLLDTVLFMSAGAALALVLLVLMLPWLAKYLWDKLTARKPRPAAQS
ncbi:MAG: hypothetical protein ACRYFS_09375 [Janthinobacterium lividum]